MMEKENMQDIIGELDEIDSLMNQGACALNMVDQIKNEAEEQKHENMTAAREELRAFEKKAAKTLNQQFPRGCALDLPAIPCPNFTTLVKEKTKQWIFRLTLLVLVVGCVPGFLIESLWWIPTLAFIVLMIELCALQPNRENLNNYKQWTEKVSQWTKEYAAFDDEAEKKFLKQCQEYDRLFQTFVHECDAKNEEAVLRLVEQDAKIDLASLDMQKEQLEEAQRIQDELDKKTVVSSDYFHLAHNISRALKTGRADTLKEALNLAIEEERKENEEAERRAEAQRQEKIMERRADEERRHNAAMQHAAEEQARATREHNAAMEREAKRANDLAKEQQKKQEEAAKRQAEKDSSAAYALCAKCANSTRCAWNVKGKNPNCAAYRPR